DTAQGIDLVVCHRNGRWPSQFSGQFDDPVDITLPVQFDDSVTEEIRGVDRAIVLGKREGVRAFHQASSAFRQGAVVPAVFVENEDGTAAHVAQVRAALAVHDNPRRTLEPHAPGAAKFLIGSVGYIEDVYRSGPAVGDPDAAAGIGGGRHRV